MEEELFIDVSHTHDINHINFNNNKLNLLCLNIYNLKNKLEALNEFIDSRNYLIHILILTEIWIYENQNLNFNIINYTAYFCNRNNSRSGGVAIYVHNTIPSNKLLTLCRDNNEFLIVELLSCKLKIIGVYKQPRSDITEFINVLDEVLQSNKNVILTGDMNINLLDSISNTCLTYCYNSLLQLFNF